MSPRPSALARLARPSRVVGIVLLLLGLGLQLAAGESGMPWRQAWWNFMHGLAPRERPGPDGAPAVVVAIDAESTRALGAWPWPRDVLATLVRRIDELGAAALAIEVPLDTPDPFSPPRLAARYRALGAGRAAEALGRLDDTDAIFLDALRQLPAVLPLAGIPGGPPGASGRGCAFPRPPVRATGPLPYLEAQPDAAIPPLGSLLAERPDLSGLGLGAVGLRAARGLVLRKVEAVQRICDAPVLMLGAEALRLARGAAPAVIRPTPTGLAVHLGDPGDPAALGFPVERDGSFWLHFGRFGGAAGQHPRAIPAAALLRPGFDAGRIAGRIVLLAVVESGRPDEHRSPLGELVSGVEAQVQLIEQIVAGDFLRRPWFMGWAETALLLAGCLLVVALGPGARPEVAVVLIAAGVGAVMAASYAAFRLGLLVDAASPAAGITVVAAGTLVATLIERDRARLVSEVALADERADRAQLQGELDAAAGIQQMLLPAHRFRLPGRLDLAAHVEPARQVGGDFYDHFMLGDRHLFFLVADVSGKGAEASQFMLLSRTLWKSVALRTGPELGAIQRQANAEILRENAATMFVTGFCGLLDVETGELAYAAAGHDAPFVLGNGRPPARLELDAGPPLGIVADADYPIGHIRLVPGDRLCLFSDGISEAMDGAGRRFGLDRLRATLAAIPSDADSAAVIARILAHAAAFTGDAERSDDLTLLVVSRTA